MKETILQEADRLVSEVKGKDYGQPLDQFTATAKIWEVILGKEGITPEQVGLCMIAIKMTREMFKHKRDNLVDIPGYAKTIDMVIEERKRRG